MSTCEHTNIHPCVYAGMRANSCMHTDTHTDTHTQTNTHTHTPHTHTHTHTPHTHTHTRKHTHTHTHAPTHTHTQTHTHTDTHTHTHAHTHTRGHVAINASRPGDAAGTEATATNAAFPPRIFIETTYIITNTCLRRFPYNYCSYSIIYSKPYSKY